ncbi:calmodulin-interacting protein 111 isoform X1 [Tanacetum coccineum]
MAQDNGYAFVAVQEDGTKTICIDCWFEAQPSHGMSFATRPKPDREAMWVYYQMHHSIMGHTTTNRGLAATGIMGLEVGQGGMWDHRFLLSNMEIDVDINTLTMEQYLAWVQDDIRPGVVKPKIGNDVEFEININFMTELRRKLFKGTDDEDAHEHVQRVLEIANLFHFPGVTHDVVMLRVFHITLKGPALRWINILSAGLVTTWDFLEKAFIRQYCLPFKTAKKLEEIRNFKQEHDPNSQQRVHIFYTGLYIPTRIMLDSKGFIPLMTPTQALKSIQVMADHSRNWYDEATTKERIEVKERMTMGKENVKEPVPRDLPVVQTYVPPTKFLGSPSRTHQTICMMGITEEIHKMEALEDEGNTDDGWFRKILTPTIHTLPNLEPMVQSYVTRGPVHDKGKVVREKEQDYDIPL